MTNEDQTYTMLIDGAAMPGEGMFSVLNPATETAAGYAPRCSSDQLNTAIAAARRAFSDWSQKSFAERSDVVFAVGAALEAGQDELAAILTIEQGKPLAEARMEVLGAAARCREAAQMMLEDKILRDDDAMRIVIKRVPIGVVGALVPWNFPVVIGMIKMTMAMLAGNTVVLKPSPFTPLTTLRIGEMIRDIVPRGVVNIVSGGDELGPLMTRHPGIDKVSFTGSIATGRKVMESAAGSLKRLTLELGGNDPAIVLPDVDVAATAEALFWGALRNAGQVCVATKRIYVHQSIYAAFRDAFIQLAQSAQIGPGTQPGVRIGPVQNREQYERILRLVAESRAAGLTIVSGGKLPDGPGYFLPVTVIDNPPEDARIVQEEQFGPIVPILAFEDLDTLILRINSSDYGLGASVWSSNIDHAEAIADRIATGTVWINQSSALTPMTPFGGMRQSGIGVEGGQAGLNEYTQIKVISRKR